MLLGLAMNYVYIIIIQKSPLSSFAFRGQLELEADDSLPDISSQGQ